MGYDYCVRGGHNYGVRGASSPLLDEVEFDRLYYADVCMYLKQCGKTVVDGTPNKTNTKNEDLAFGVNIAKQYNAKYFISCHVNDDDDEKSNGCEVIHYPTSKEGKVIAERVVNKLSDLGFKNRGAKSDTRGLYELNHTKMPAIIIEPFFLRNKHDVDLALKLGHKRIAKAIVEGILNTTIKDTPSTSSIYPLPLKLTKDCKVFTISNNYPKSIKEFKMNDCITAQDSVNDYYMLDIDGTRGYVPISYTTKR